VIDDNTFPRAQDLVVTPEATFGLGQLALTSRLTEPDCPNQHVPVGQLGRRPLLDTGPGHR
jgi:hypothetical protein